MNCADVPRVKHYKEEGTLMAEKDAGTSTEKGIGYASSFKEQFTLRGILIGVVGCVIITTSSMYIALKMGALPWPIFFVVLVSLFALKAFAKLGRKTNLNEVNVTHTVMSAGAMVAGGVAFTIPGVWILDKGAEVSMMPLLVATLGGVVLGLVFIALLRKHFIEDEELVYPMGTAAAETLAAGDQGGRKAKWLFGSMGVAGVFTALRDWFMAIPTMALSGVAIPGVAFGIYLSPMMISVGYILGPALLLAWFAGGLIGDFGIVVGGTAAGLWDLATASGIKTSLGIGVMVGTGIGIICKSIIPKTKSIFSPTFKKESRSNPVIGLVWVPLVMAALALAFTFVLDLGIVASVIVILGVWLTTAMSAQIVGQTGINPMEVFGVIILLCVKVASSAGQLELFLVAAIVAVACGLVGDVMNDFKVGHIVKSDPRAQWFGEGIGAIVGALVSVGVFMVLLRAYGPGAFGTGQTFVAAQASVVAAMVGGIPNLTAFIIGLVAGAVLYFCGLPVMTLGLGIYLPFYLSLTAAVGGLLKFILDRAASKLDADNTGTIIASGLLGGESVVGVVIALILVCSGAAAL